MYGLYIQYPGKRVLLIFQDEAGFGRINKPKYCRCTESVRPEVPCHHIREYRYAYGAVEPLSGEHFFLILPYCNTVCMNVFMKELSETYRDDLIVMVCDGAAWHKSKAMRVPGNIRIVHIPPYTPEMNPIEQVWRELRTQGFRNEVFATLDKVEERLSETINDLAPEIVRSITLRDWICKNFWLYSKSSGKGIMRTGDVK